MLEMPIYRVELKYAVTMVNLEISSGNKNPGEVPYPSVSLAGLVCSYTGLCVGLHLSWAWSSWC